MQDDARGRVFCVCINRAAFQACRIQAVVAPHGEIASLRVRPRATFNLTKAPPVDLGRIAVLFIAGDLAGPASDAFGHVEVESILLTYFQGSLWNKLRIGKGEIAGGIRGCNQIEYRVGRETDGPGGETHECVGIC